MSHVSTIKLQVKDLNALERSAKPLGLELMRGQTTFRKFGQSHKGECEHALRVVGNDRAYEIGISKSADGKSYELKWDPWNRGYGLVDKVGEDMGKLKQGYAGEVALTIARKQGFRLLTQNRKTDGTLVYEVQR